MSIPYDQYYGALRSFFKPRRCLTCIDHYGELADVCFGDIHIKPYSEDKIGINSLIVRNPIFDEMLKNASEEGYIYFKDLDANTLNESQKVMLYPKQRRVHAMMNLDKLLFRQTAKYDIVLEKPHLKDYLSEMIYACQRYIGKHKKLWWLISLFSDK